MSKLPSDLEAMCSVPASQTGAAQLPRGQAKGLLLLHFPLPALSAVLLQLAFAQAAGLSQA